MCTRIDVHTLSVLSLTHKYKHLQCTISNPPARLTPLCTAACLPNDLESFCFIFSHSLHIHAKERSTYLEELVQQKREPVREHFLSHRLRSETQRNKVNKQTWHYRHITAAVKNSRHKAWCLLMNGTLLNKHDWPNMNCILESIAPICRVFINGLRGHNNPQVSNTRNPIKAFM